MFKTVRRRLRVLLHRYPLLPFLLAATLTVDTLILFHRSYDINNQLIEILLGAIFAQTCMLGIWVVHRIKYFGLRMILAAIVLYAYQLFGRILNSDVGEELVSYSFMTSFASALTYVTWHLVKRILNKSTLTLPNFAIRDLLQVTTGVSIFSYFVASHLVAEKPTGLGGEAIYAVLGVVYVLLLWLTSRSDQDVLKLMGPVLWFFVIAVLVTLFEVSRNYEPELIIFGPFVFFITLFFLNVGVVAMTLAWSYGLQYRRHPIRHRKKTTGHPE